MAKNNPKAQSIQYPGCIDILIRRLVSDGLIRSHIVRDCRHTSRGSPREPLVQFKGYLHTNQAVLEVHCGSWGCHKVYVVPTNPQKLQEYIASHYNGA